MKKRVLSLLLASVMLCNLLPQFVLPAHAEEEDPFDPYDPYSGTCGAEGDGSNLTWNFDPDTGVLTMEGSGAMKDYLIRDMDLDNIPLEELFYYCPPWCLFYDEVTAVNLPEGLTTIGVSAFDNCCNLGEIDIPKNVVSIGNYAFCDCDSLKSVTIPNGVTSIGESAFITCDGLTSVKLPESLTQIGDMAFFWCCSLTNVVIPSNVTKIGYYAFRDCDGMTNVTIPASVSYIGPEAFYDCNNLTAIDVVAGNANYSSENGVLFNKAKTELIQYPSQKAGTSYTIPASVTKIDDKAFYACSALQNVTIPKGVTSIGDYVFNNCYALTSVTVPEGVTSIGSNAFAHCESMTSVTIPEGVTSIDECAFCWCTSLMDVTIPSSVTNIGEYAFGWREPSERDLNLERIDGFTIHGYAGTAAQSYAEKNGFNFVALADLPTITSQPKSVAVGLGETATFSVIASGEELSYQWQYKKTDSTTWTKWTGKTEASLSVKGTSTNNGYQYRCVVSNDDGSVTSEAATLSVSSKPVITSQPKSASVLLGETATFAVTATGANLSYQWQYKKPSSTTWSKWTGKTTPSISFKATGTNNGYQYRCVVSNDDGSATSDAATLTVTTSAKPVITAQPKSVQIGFGETATFTVAATGANLSYQWQYRKPGSTTWTKWSGKTTASISFNGSATNNGYQYRCVVSNDVGSVTSDAATLTITGPIITSQPKSVNVKLGSYATMRVTATGENLSYQWQYKKPGSTTWTKWSGKTTASISFKGSATNNGYQYRCVVSNAEGSVTSSAATLTVDNLS